MYRTFLKLYFSKKLISLRSIPLWMILFCLMYNHGTAQDAEIRYLENLPFEEIESRLYDKVISFERSSTLTAINYLLLKDFSEEQQNTLRVFKLMALVESELYDEALELANEILMPINVPLDLEVKVLLERALIYEILENYPESKKDLNRIQRLYKDELPQSDELYGRFLYRLASWYRVNDRKEESLEWAEKAVDYGLEYDFSEVSATGYLILGLLSESDDVEEKLVFFKNGLELSKNANRKPATVNLYHLLSSSYFQDDQLDLAQVYNDSALQIIDAYNTKYSRVDLYKQRSAIAEALNMPDSALYYQKEYAREAIYALNRSRNIKVREFDFELQKEKAILENIKLETRLDEADRKEDNFMIILLIGAVSLLSLGFLIITLASRNRRIKEQNEEIKETNHDLSINVEEKEFLLKEVNHRVKNNLAFIQSLISFQMEDAKTLETTTNLESLNNRIHAIAVLHDQFVAAENSISKKEIEIEPYLSNIADAQIMVNPEQVSFDLEMNGLKVNLETAVPLGILVNELITNSIKHADPGSEKLAIELTLAESDNNMILDYKDNGKVFELAPDSENLGLYIIKTMVRQLRGIMNRDGSSYHIVVKRKR